MTTFRDVVASLNPTHGWNLDEKTGTVADDAVGTLDGTYVGSPALGVPGLIAEGTAVDFEASTPNRVDLPDHADLKGFTSLSIIAVVKAESGPAAFNARGFMGHRAVGVGMNTPGQWNWSVLDSSGPRLSFVYYNGTTESSFNSSVVFTYTLGARFFFGMTCVIGGTLKHYINGAQLGADVATTGTLGSTSTDTGVIAGTGFDLTTQAFDGVMDEVWFWKDAVLTAQDMAALFAALDAREGRAITFAPIPFM